MEDVHYSFVEYAGNNITHWSFLDSADKNHDNILVDRLCGKLFLIADRDEINPDSGIIDKKQKSKRHKELKKKLGNRFYLLQCREIENLLTPNIIINTLNNFKKEDLLKKNLFTYEEYQLEPLGNFIDERFNKILKKKYAAKSGTISNKVDFAKEVVTLINNKNDMSKEAIQLTEKLYSFIGENNSFLT